MSMFRHLRDTNVMVDGFLIHETTEAFLIRDDQGTEEWVPRSQVPYLRKGPIEPDGVRSISAELPLWLADEKGFSYE